MANPGGGTGLPVTAPVILPLHIAGLGNLPTVNPFARYPSQNAIQKDVRRSDREIAQIHDDLLWKAEHQMHFRQITNFSAEPILCEGLASGARCVQDRHARMAVLTLMDVLIDPKIIKGHVLSHIILSTNPDFVNLHCKGLNTKRRNMLIECFNNVKKGLEELIGVTGGINVWQTANPADRDTAVLHIWDSQPLLTARSCFAPLAVGVDFNNILKRRTAGPHTPPLVIPLRRYIRDLFLAMTRIMFRHDISGQAYGTR